MKLYLLRHGHTNFNESMLCTNDPLANCHLTKKGVEQANRAKKLLSKINFDQVYITPLFRTLQTAHIVCGNKINNMTVDYRLTDRNTGFEGRPVAEFLDFIKEDPLNIKYGNGESFLEEKQRVQGFVNDLSRLASSFENVLIVAHFDIVKLIWGIIKNEDDLIIVNKMIDNCELLEVELTHST
jgi:alpha-ribazole phosphatase